MKSKVRILTLVGLLSGTLTGIAQDNTTAPATGSATAPAAASTPAATPIRPEWSGGFEKPSSAPATAAETPAATPAETPAATPAETPAATPPAPSAEAAPAPAATPEAPAATAVAANDAAAPAPAATPAATPAAAPAAQPGAIIPLIVMDDVPLTDAIRNLARQAGLNYMLDPKIGFGQPDAAGHVVPQPSVSIRWEGITAEQALNALLANHSLQLIEDPKTKIARVTTKDPAAPPDLVTRVIQLKYSSPSNVVAAVQSALTDKRSKVVTDVRTSQLVILATEKELVDVEALVVRLDTQTKQVLIEAKLLEASANPSTKKGIDWTGTLDSQHFTIGNSLTTPGGIVANLTRGQATPANVFLTADGVNATLSFLNTYAEGKTIASPRTVTLDNETAHISVTDVRPIINVTAGTANTTGGSTITYTNLGITLDVTPRISANDFVNLKVIPQVSRFTGQDKRTINGEAFVVDLYAARTMNTTVMIPSGHTLVLGGMIQDEITYGNVKVPLLGDIPYLGYLFRSDSKNRTKKNLIVFVTPTIVTDEDYQLTPTTYLKTPVPSSDLLEEKDWSAWDSGQRKDWHKKGGTIQD